MVASPLLFLRVARLFQDAGGRACLQAQGSTRCLGDGAGPLVLGGVQLNAVQRNGGVVRFQFTLQQDVALGTLRLTGQAEASGLAFYAVDGGLEALDLLSWTSLSLTDTVQWGMTQRG